MRLATIIQEYHNRDRSNIKYNTLSDLAIKATFQENHAAAKFIREEMEAIKAADLKLATQFAIYHICSEINCKVPVSGPVYISTDWTNIMTEFMSEFILIQNDETVEDVIKTLALHPFYITAYEANNMLICERHWPKSQTKEK